jgi:DNA-binding HxlR family transcriptional regulator
VSRSGVPKPGVPVRGSVTGRPVMAALDLLGRRWSLRVLWELRDGPVGARALLERCEGLSSSVLYDRLRDLAGAGLIDKDAQGDYRLTDLGADLGAALGPLDAWAKRWARRSPA